MAMNIPNSIPTTNGKAKSRGRGPQFWFLVILSVVALATIASAVIVTAQHGWRRAAISAITKRKNALSTTSTALATATTSAPVVMASSASYLAPDEPVKNTGKPIIRTTTSSAATSTVVWQIPQKIKKLGLFFSSKSDYPDYFNEEESTYYQVGTLTYQGVPAQLIYVVSEYLEGQFEGGQANSFFIKLNNKIIYLPQYTPQIGRTAKDRQDQIDALVNSADKNLNSRKIIIGPNIRLTNLDFPEMLPGPAIRQKLYLPSYGILAVFNRVPSSTKTAFTDSTWGEVKVLNNSDQTHQSAGTFFSRALSGSFFIKQGPFYIFYELRPDFYDRDKLVPQIIWNNGQKNTMEFSYTGSGGCGSGNFIEVVNPTDINVTKDLVVAGKNNQADPIYELKNKNHPRLKNAYKFFSEGVYNSNLSYAQFLKSHPILYWLDPFDRLIELTNKRMMPGAECGKPVIYLYPEKTIAVSVKLEPQGGFTYTEPDYADGWNVEATPAGQLTELKNGIKTARLYPYLFWEGRGGHYETPAKGWVVKKEEVEAFLRQKLAQAGLNNKESADFMEFWLPRMQEKPYYFITFMGNSVMNQLAPLTIDPRPDTVIRILMDYTALDEPRAVEPFTIHTPVRRGFTVVEWGGVLR